jgi:fucose permease
MKEQYTMNDNEILVDDKDKEFVRTHWRMMAVIAAFFSVAAATGLYVALWFVASTQAVGFVPAAIGQWTIGYAFSFILHLIFWELLLVASWVLVIVALIFTQWYNKLPVEEHREGSKRHSRKESNAFSFLVGLTWLIVVWLDGNWNLAFQSWSLDYLVYSCLAALAWDLLIFGIPIALFFIWWIRKNPSE